SDLGLARRLGLQHLLYAAIVTAGRHLDRRKIFALDNQLDLVGIEDFTLKQSRGHAVHDVFMVREDLHCGLIPGIDQLTNLLVDMLRSLFAEVAMLIDLAAEEDLLFLLAKRDRAERAHAELANHSTGEIGSLLDVVAGASRHLAEENLFSHASTHHDGQSRFQIFLGVRVLIVDGQLHGYPQCHSARDDRDFVQRVGVLAHSGDECVTSFVICRDLLLVVREQHRLALRAHQDFVLRNLEIVHVNRFAVLRSGVERRFIHHGGQVGAGKSRCAASQDREIDIVSDRNLARVYAKNLLAAAHVGTRYHDATIKPSRTQQSRIENVGTIRGGDQNYALIRLEAVHLNKQLVERLLALVVSTAKASAAVASYGVDFVDKDDARRVLLALLKQIAYTTRAYADEHLNEIRTRNREERYVSFTGYRAGKQSLSRSGRSDE